MSDNFPSAAGYEYLLTYKLSIVVYDLTVQFTKRWINLYSRTGDQMVQAGRSGKQNIAEGFKQVSLKSYIKLTGVSLGSEEELLNDVQDFSRQNGIKVYTIAQAKQMREVREVWELINNNLPYRPDHPHLLPQDKEKAVNLMLTLLNQLTFLLRKQVKSLEEKFVREGGFSENLLKKRLNERKKNENFY